MFNSKSIFTGLFLTLLLGGHLLATTGPAANTSTSLITLRAGTIVSVELNEELEATDLAVGNAIDLMVRSNVLVNGRIVIASGAAAQGIVKKVNRGCNGDCVQVTISVESVQSVDGQSVFLRSIPHIMKSNCCSGNGNQNTTLSIGTKINARVLNDININA